MKIRKIAKKFCLIVMVLLLSLVICSCGDDEEEENLSNIPQRPKNTPTEEPLPVEDNLVDGLSPDEYWVEYPITKDTYGNELGYKIYIKKCPDLELYPNAFTSEDVTTTQHYRDYYQLFLYPSGLATPSTKKGDPYCIYICEDQFITDYDPESLAMLEDEANFTIDLDEGDKYDNGMEFFTVNMQYNDYDFGVKYYNLYYTVTDGMYISVNLYNFIYTFGESGYEEKLERILDFYATTEAPFVVVGEVSGS